MTKMKTLLLAAGLAALTIPVAQAQQASTTAENPEMIQDVDFKHGDGHRGEGHRGGYHGRGHGERGEGRGMGRGMRMIDANGDGAIGDDEAAGLAERMFMRLDRDGDGNISETEFTTPRHRGWRAWFGSDEAEAVTKVRKEKFVALDANKNLGIDKPEFLADAKAKLAAADTDKDGKVSPWEFRAAR